MTERRAWKALEAHRKKIEGRHLHELFAEEPRRGERMTAEAVGPYLEYSKNRITDETLPLPCALTEDCDLRGRIVP